MNPATIGANIRSFHAERAAKAMPLIEISRPVAQVAKGELREVEWKEAIPESLFGQTGQAKSAAVIPAEWPGGHCTSSIL